MLQAQGVGYTIGEHALLAGVDLDVIPGSIVALIGPNGAGKSTLLRILAGEIRPISGSVRLDGQDLLSLSAAELARRRAVVPQSSSLTFPFTVLEVAMLGISVPGFEGTSTRATTAGLEALEAVGMRRLADRLYVHLSGGERQRVHIARALCQLTAVKARANVTRCFFLDEPTSSLDLAHQGLVLSAIRRQGQAGVAIITVFHDLNLAAALADTLVLLEGGRVLAAGPPADVLNDSLLSTAYGCRVVTNRTPAPGHPFILPPAIFTDPNGRPDAAVEHAAQCPHG
jgi:iron complex transport system ATP-binding protein